MAVKCGIVGLPNVGKSTLFNALTEAGIDAANYPFCTIEPNVGMVTLPDKRLDLLAEIVTPERVIPTTTEFVDIAGLVAGASKGEGLGNKFLAHIRETDAIAHVVRCFENEDIAHVSGTVDPISDIETIETELILADLETVTKGLQRAERNAKSGNKDALRDKALLERLEKHLGEGKIARTLSLSDDEAIQIRRFQLITTKPVLYVANVDESGFENNPLLDKVTEHAKTQGSSVVAICAAFEAEIAGMPNEEKVAFLEELGLHEAGLNRFIRAAYDLLGLMTFFTAGKKEVRAWTVKRDASAPQAAGAIHTDFEKGFIRAEVVGFDDYVTHQGEQGAKKAGKFRTEGKTYIVQDGDVMHFLFNV